MTRKIAARVYPKIDPHGRCIVSIHEIKFEFTRVLVRHAAGAWGDVHMNGNPTTEQGMLNELRWCYGIEADFDMGRVLAALDKSLRAYESEKERRESLPA